MGTEKKSTDDAARSATEAFAALQEMGLGNMMGIGTAWLEAMSDMGAEVIGFVADRIKEDVKTQHEILHCKDAAELQRIQARFFEKAVKQYQDETGKLVEMSTFVFAQENAPKTK